MFMVEEIDQTLHHNIVNSSWTNLKCVRAGFHSWTSHEEMVKSDTMYQTPLNKHKRELKIP